MVALIAEPLILRGSLPDWAASGDGDGYGDGCGDGYGYGYGYGDGYGDGYGYAAYWVACIQYFARKWNDVQQERLQELRRANALIAFWRSNRNGTPANSGSGPPVSHGVVQREKGPLRTTCGEGQLHATRLPPKWKGDRWWVVALLGEVRGDDEKYWALEREIIGECE